MNKIKGFYVLLGFITWSMIAFSCKKSQDLTPKLIRPFAIAETQALKENIDTKYCIDIKGLGESKDGFIKRSWRLDFMVGGWRDTKDFFYSETSNDDFLSLSLSDLPLHVYSTSKLAFLPLYLYHESSIGGGTWEIIIRQGEDKDLSVPREYASGKEIQVLDSYTNASSKKKYEIVLVNPLANENIKATIKPKGDTMYITITLSLQLF